MSAAVYSFIYNILLILAYPLVLLLSRFDRKLNASRRGQLNRQALLELRASLNKPVLWFHAASGGELEQLITLAERLYLADRYSLILSISSKTIEKKAKGLYYFEQVFYAPWDLPRRTLNYVEILKPLMYINTRHDLWFNLLKQFKRNAIPSVLINANLYPGSGRLKSWSKPFNRLIFKQITHIFAVSERNRLLLQEFTGRSVLQTGDTRFDRVSTRKLGKNGLLLPDRSSENLEPRIIYGSSIDSDMQIILDSIEKCKNSKLSLQHILVPHETDDLSIRKWEGLFQSRGIASQRRSRDGKPSVQHVLIWDRVGELADLYGESELAYVGAGFSSGVHNVIEPAVYGIPVAYGPEDALLDEAFEMRELNVSYPVYDSEDLFQFLQLTHDPDEYVRACRKTLNYVEQRLGATERILQALKL